jgi:hypothetical protein
MCLQNNKYVYVLCYAGGIINQVHSSKYHSKCTCTLLTVNSSIKVRLDLQADKSPVIVKGPFFPRVVNPRYRIRGKNVRRKRLSSKAKQLQSLVKEKP